MIWQGIDKRRFPRAEYPCKVVILRNDLKETFSTHTENIGTGGICVVLPRELPKFCLVRVLLYLKDGGGLLECDGRIIWAVKREDYFDTGLEFLDIRETDRLRIEKVVQQCLEKQI